MINPMELEMKNCLLMIRDMARVHLPENNTAFNTIFWIANEAISEHGNEPIDADKEDSMLLLRAALVRIIRIIDTLDAYDGGAECKIRDLATNALEKTRRSFNDEITLRASLARIKHLATESNSDPKIIMEWISDEAKCALSRHNMHKTGELQHEKE